MRIQILITAKELIDRGLFIELCSVTDVSQTTLDEAKVDENTVFALSLKEALDIGILN